MIMPSQYISNVTKDYIDKKDLLEKNYSDLLKKKNIWIDNSTDPYERLGWIDSSKNINETLLASKKVLKNLVSKKPSDIVFIGMGGSIQTGKAISQIFGPKKGIDLYFIDTTNPLTIDKIANKININSTYYIVMSKSGGTLETECIRDFFINLLKNKKIEDFGKYFISLTDKGTSLESFSKDNNFAANLTTPSTIGGRFSSSTYYGIIPSLLTNIKEKQIEESFSSHYDEHTKQSAIKLAHFINNSFDINNHFKIVIPKELSEFGTWIEQLLAESSGKNGKGIIPVLIESNNNINNELSCIVNISNSKIDTLSSNFYINLNRGFIFRDMMIWKLAVSICCKYIDVFPFDEPDVKISKVNTQAIINNETSLNKINLPENSSNFLEIINNNIEKDIIFINSFLPEEEPYKKYIKDLKEIASKSNNQIIITGYGPRYLHSTGQLQKGGPRNICIIYVYLDLNEQFRNKTLYRDLADTFKAQILGDFTANLETLDSVYFFSIENKLLI